MLTDLEKKHIKSLEEEYAKCEQKALDCKTEKTEQKYLNRMDAIYKEIGYICTAARKRKNEGKI